MNKHLTTLLIFLAGWAVGFVINFTFSFGSVRLTFCAAIGMCLGLGLLLGKLSNLRQLLFCFGIAAHFIMVALVTIYLPHIPLLVGASIVAFYLGAVSRRQAVAKRQLLATAISLVALVLGAFGGYQGGAYISFDLSVAHENSGMQRADFSLTQQDGSVVSQDQLEGKVVVVAFLRNDCVPCDAMRQKAKELAASYLDNEKVEVLFSIAKDSTTGVPKPVPAMAIFGPSGQEQFLQRGFNPEIEDVYVSKMSNAIEQVLGQKQE